MSSTTDEDWSIISSSDYEEDVPSSPQNSSGGERDRERREDDLVNASVSTVKQIPDLQGASLGLYADSVLLTSGVALDPTQGLDMPPGKGANRAGAQTLVSNAHDECPWPNLARRPRPPRTMAPRALHECALVCAWQPPAPHNYFVTAMIASK